MRITAQLNDVTTGAHIWAERYDRELKDVFAVQDEITEAIVAAIEPQLYAAENFRAQRKPPDSMDAWDLVMRALSHYWRVTRQDNVVAQALLEKAVAIDPNYGQALGCSRPAMRSALTWDGRTWRLRVPIAEKAARAAIQIDREDPWAHEALGLVHLFARRFDDSLAEFELALRLNPNFALAQGLYGLVLSYCGRWEEADVAANRALRLSPRDPFSAIYLRDRRLCPVLGTQLREGDAARARGASANAPISSAAIAFWSPPPAWRRRGHRKKCARRSCAARSQTFRSPGSAIYCRSSVTPIASTISKACDARASPSSERRDRLFDRRICRRRRDAAATARLEAAAAVR